MAFSIIIIGLVSLCAFNLKALTAIESDNRAILSESRDALNVQNCYLLNDEETEDAFYQCMYGPSSDADSF